MSAEIRELAEVWGPPTCVEPVPADRFDAFRGVVPDLLLEYWREYGFAGFGDGLFWLCDPAAWQPAVDAWTRNLDLPFGDDWIAVTRTAFGTLDLWGRRTGMSLSISPHSGWVIHRDRSERMTSPFERDSQIYAALMSGGPESADLTGDDEEPLFVRLRDALGPVGPDAMYGFFPARALGGALSPDHAEIVDAEVHLELLADLTPRRVMDTDDLAALLLGR
ncbi:GAD-like domain-containing protein [Nocardia sp. NPDC024068]|uniref:GAD-like domain-containing protein n=1 Tax=Nocardia sp. NPDC024068 TaxID=3157197 RepID=UPI0033E1510A